MRAKDECFLVEDNGLIEVLQCPELVVPSGEMNCYVVQRPRPIGVPLREKAECFSVEDNGLIEVLQCPELVVASGETICKVVQRR